MKDTNELLTEYVEEKTIRGQVEFINIKNEIKTDTQYLIIEDIDNIYTILEVSNKEYIPLTQTANYKYAKEYIKLREKAKEDIIRKYLIGDT